MGCNEWRLANAVAPAMLLNLAFILIAILFLAVLGAFLFRLYYIMFVQFNEGALYFNLRSSWNKEKILKKKKRKYICNI